MFAPTHCARTVKLNQIICFRNQSRHVAAFVAIAENTCEGKVFQFRSAAVFAANYMFNLKFEKSVFFGYQAIFAYMMSANGDNAPSFESNITHSSKNRARELLR